MLAENQRAAALQAARAQRALKRPQQEASYIGFLLRERRRLREFGRQTHVLETTVLPPGVRPAPGLQGFFVQSLQAWSSRLSPALKGLLEHGWLHLTPYQYNLLALLRRLSDRILAFDFVRLDYRSRHLVDRLRRIEQPFLTLACRGEHLVTILAAIRRVADKTHMEAEECAQLCTLAERLLAAEASLPSLHNALLGLNSVRNRRLTLLGDLVDLESPGLAGLINSRDFDGGAGLRRRIDDYLQESLDSLRKLHAELSEVRRLAGYVHRGADGEADTGALAAFYAFGGHDLNADLADTVLFAQRLCRRFDRVFFDLLGGRVTIADRGALRIFSRNFFENELDRLRGVGDKLEKGPFHFTNFPLQRYLRIQAGGLAAIGNEAEASALVQEAVAILVDLGKTAVRLLSLVIPAASPASAASAASAGGEAVQPPAALEPIVLQGRGFNWPAAGLRIGAPSALAGLSVAEALRQLVEVSLSVGLLCRDRFLDLFLAKRRRLESDLEARVRLLENLMAPEEHRELVASLR